METGAQTWLLVAWGEGIDDAIARAMETVEPADPAAHHMVLREDGPRRAVLLVHWSEAGRDAVVQGLGDPEHVFVNRVEDVSA